MCRVKPCPPLLADAAFQKSIIDLAARVGCACIPSFMKTTLFTTLGEYYNVPLLNPFLCKNYTIFHYCLILQCTLVESLLYKTYSWNTCLVLVESLSFTKVHFLLFLLWTCAHSDVRTVKEST